MSLFVKFQVYFRGEHGGSGDNLIRESCLIPISISIEILILEGLQALNQFWQGHSNPRQRTWTEKFASDEF